MVAFIQKGSSADNDGQIRVGDKICSINGVDFANVTNDNNTLDVLKNSGISVSLVLERGNILHVFNYAVHHFD